MGMEIHGLQPIEGLLVSRYSKCPGCGKKGLYRWAYAPGALRVELCRYCGWGRSWQRWKPKGRYGRQRVK